MAVDRTKGKDPSHLSGPSVRHVRRSYVEEQYPTFVRNNRLRASDLRPLRQEASAFGYRPPISVLMVLLHVVGHEQPLQKALDSVVAQLYPHWELIVCCATEQEGRAKELLCRYERLDERIKLLYSNQEEEERGEASLSNEALSLAQGEFVCFLGEGDELSPDALFEVVKLLQEHPQADLIYSDEDAIGEEGKRSRPRFKPGFSPDLLLSTNYISRSGVYRRTLVEELGGMRESFEGSEDYDLLLRLTERAEEVFHISRVLYHRRKGAASFTPAADRDEGRVREAARHVLSEALKRRGLEGRVEDGLLAGTFRVRPKIKSEPKVSIIIPTRDNVSLLKNGVESIERLTSYPNYEILIVDNDSTEPETLEYLAKTPHRVIPFREEFNYSRINNFAVSRAEGEYILLLNDDIEVISGGWLEAMLEHAQRPEVGAVGARLIYPDGRIQHAGVLTGVGGSWGSGVATHSHQFYASASAGYMGALATTTNYSVVTAACMLLRKSVFDEVRGFDEENLRVSFNDVDLCLRIRELGYSVVYTPYAELYHHESVSRGYKGDPAEGLYMRKRWGEVLDKDPYYNPHFSRGSGDFNLRADLLRPRVIRQEERRPEVPAGWFDNPLTTSPEERKKFIEIQQRAARDSYRTTIVPSYEGKSARIAAVEDIERDEGPSPRRGAQLQSVSPEQADAQETRETGTRRSLREERMVWMFGSPRTGSTWLSKMMAELENQERWNEPYVGLLFGSFLYERLEANTKLLNNPSFILSESHRNVWLKSVKDFVIEGATARYPNLDEDEYLIIKEPNGSVGASLLMEAMPESRMIFLIRDPRDVVASRLDAVDRGGWTRQERDLDTTEKLNAFTRHLAEDYFRVVSQVQKAYEEHQGKEAFVRYEDLRRDTVGTLKTMYGELEIGFDQARLEEAVAKHSWDQVPESNKGSGKFYRKAEVGGWREDLSPEQIRIIEEVTAPILSMYF